MFSFCEMLIVWDNTLYKKHITEEKAEFSNPIGKDSCVLCNKQKENKILIDSRHMNVGIHHRMIKVPLVNIMNHLFGNIDIIRVLIIQCCLLCCCSISLFSTYYYLLSYATGSRYCLESQDRSKRCSPSQRHFAPSSSRDALYSSSACSSSLFLASSSLLALLVSHPPQFSPLVLVFLWSFHW